MQQLASPALCFSIRHSAATGNSSDNNNNTGNNAQEWLGIVTPHRAKGQGGRVLGVTMRAQNGGTHLCVPRARGTRGRTCSGGNGTRNRRDGKDTNEINVMRRHALRYRRHFFFCRLHPRGKRFFYRDCGQPFICDFVI